MANPFADTMKAFGLPAPPDRRRPPTELERAEAALFRKARPQKAPTPAEVDLRPMTVQERFAGKGSDGVDIFIGGGADDLHFRWRPGELGPMSQYAQDYRMRTGRPTRYFPNNQTDRVLDAVREAQTGDGPINLVGHSWGGTDAYNIAARAAQEGLRIDNLGTLDPVGGNFGLAPARGREAVGRWINVTAVPRNFDLTSDGAAWLGGKPSQVPVAAADRHVDVSAGHADVDVMMQRSGVRRMLDLSRTRYAGREVRDDLATPEWMRRRSAQRPTPRTWP